MIVFVISLVMSSYQIDEDAHNKLEEFFGGLKPNKKHKFHIVVFLLRRLVFSIILITVVSAEPTTIIGIIAGLQIIFLIYL